MRQPSKASLGGARAQPAAGFQHSASPTLAGCKRPRRGHASSGVRPKPWTRALSPRERPRAGLAGARAQLAEGALDAALEVRVAHQQHAHLVPAHQHDLQALKLGVQCRYECRRRAASSLMTTLQRL